VRRRLEEYRGVTKCVLENVEYTLKFIRANEDYLPDGFPHVESVARRARRAARFY
jgi:hypothetical protein